MARAFIPFFPLASSLLTGKYRRGEEGPAGARLSGRAQIGTGEQFCGRRGADQVAANVAAGERAPSEADLAALSALLP